MDNGQWIMDNGQWIMNDEKVMLQLGLGLFDKML
jgi:hypothetical protein